jgi:hypothetical protein
MSVLGQSGHFDGAPITSALPLEVCRHVSKVPIGDIARLDANEEGHQLRVASCERLIATGRLQSQRHVTFAFV